MAQFESDFEERFYKERQEKLARIAELGVKAGLTPAEAIYPNTFRFSTDIPSIRSAYDPATAEELDAAKPTVAIAGRLVAIRLQGKAGFAQLQQGGQRLQIYVRKDNVGEDPFELYRLLDLGDHIGVEGTLFRTRTGELTVQVAPLAPGNQPITFLAKAMLPLPDKYAGLGDIELRYRRRYLDLFTDTGDFAEATSDEPLKETEAALKETGSDEALKETGSDEALKGTGSDEALKGTGFSPSVEPAQETGALAPEGDPAAPHQTRLPAREVFVKRAAILRSIRNFFDTRGYLEVETPMLHTVAGGAAARPFNTHHNALDIPLSLRIAPELYLKRLVVGGLDRVYEINRNFRNEGVSTQHNPEFTMLEFYQAYANYHDLMDLTEHLITFVANEVNGTTVTNFPIPKGPRAGDIVEIDLEKWQRLSMVEAIEKWLPRHMTPRPSATVFNSREDLDRWMEAVYENNPFKDKFYQRSLLSDKTPISPEEHFPDYYTFHVLWSALKDGTETGKVITGLFEAFSEPHLIQPTIIYDFPLAVSPLSKVKPDEPDWVERFEFYIGGFEVGNAFSELNDPADQLARFEAQVADKDPESMAAVDEDYVRALGYGLPPTAGEGIGIDRLTMILTGSRSIRDVILFPLMRPTKPDPTSDKAS